MRSWTSVQSVVSWIDDDGGDDDDDDEEEDKGLYEWFRESLVNSYQRQPFQWNNITNLFRYLEQYDSSPFVF